MPAGKYTLRIEQGAYCARSLTYKDADGVPVDLTGCTARMQIRDYIEDAEVKLSISTESGNITLGGTAGTIDIEILTAQTALLTTDGYYDLELILPSGEVERILQGQVLLDREVTR